MSFDRYVPSKQAARRVELLLALALLGSHVAFWFLTGFTRWWRWEVVAMLVGNTFLVLLFATPVLLGLTAILASAVDDIGVGSVLAVGVALWAMSVVGVSVYVLVNPPEGGGVYGGHIFSSIAGMALVIVVLLRRLLDRLFARLWRNEGGFVPRGE